MSIDGLVVDAIYDSERKYRASIASSSTSTMVRTNSQYQTGSKRAARNLGTLILEPTCQNAKMPKPRQKSASLLRGNKTRKISRRVSSRSPGTLGPGSRRRRRDAAPLFDRPHDCQRAFAAAQTPYLFLGAKGSALARARVKPRRRRDRPRRSPRPSARPTLRRTPGPTSACAGRVIPLRPGRPCPVATLVSPTGRSSGAAFRFAELQTQRI